jgi:2-oxoglutarate ferredoxin oxidoreductase subunit beta
MDTYGVHGIHGRAPAIATGVKLANPELDVWVITGDGDGLSIGGNHTIHTIRRNVDLKIILFNNRIYGLTKSSPMGTVDYPMHPLCVAIGAEATFVARAIDVDVKHLQEILRRAALHKGTAYVEVYQDCNVFNHDAFGYATDRAVKEDNVLYLEHGKPMIFGKDRKKGIRLNGFSPEVVDLDGNVAPDDLLIHDERAVEPTLAYLLSRMRHPEFPEPVGVFRAIERPTYDGMVMEQIQKASAKSGPGNLEKLLNSGDTWTVE